MAALRKLPYIPLYVQDFISDEKLRMCSASSVGVYIMLLCVLHRSEEYGVLRLKNHLKCEEKDKKNEGKSDVEVVVKVKQKCEKSSKNFAAFLKKQLPFSLKEIKNALDELSFYGVISLGDEILCQPRMQRDAEKSDKHSKAGKAGMQKRYKSEDKKEENNSINDNNFVITKTQQNAEIEIEIENNNITRQKEKENIKEKESPEAKKNEDALHAEMMSSPGWREVMCMRHHISEEELRSHADVFKLDVECNNKGHTDLTDIRTHFNNWLRKQLENRQRHENDRRRSFDVTATRKEDYEGPF